MYLKPAIFLLLLPGYVFAQKGVEKETIEVSALANVYFHEIRDTSMVPGGAGIPPIAIDVRGFEMITFEGAEGEVSAYKDRDSTYFGADGGFYGEKTSVAFGTGFVALSGIVHREKVMFLVGAFQSELSRIYEPPRTIDFTNKENYDYRSYCPALNQVFYIGDGIREDGAKQLLIVPRDAEVLYIGFADCLSGPPRHYNDNGGSIKITVVKHPKAEVRN